MDKLKQYINENKEAFEQELPKNHFKRFQKKRSWRNNFILKHAKSLSVAATLLMLFSIGGSYYLNNRDVVERFFADPLQYSALPKEVVTAIDYYTNSSDKKLRSIQTLNLKDNQVEEIKRFAEKELKEYEKNRELLKKKLKENPQNDKIKRALIMNEMNKEAFLERIIAQVKDVESKSL
ncbi:MAG TPA: hypothetical protein VJ939_00270 [Bacteroidales bacterium]|nr:hypothetical protein [Bacteroidales bacterium]